MRLHVTRPRQRVAALLAAVIAGPGLVVCAALPAHAAVPSDVVWQSSAPFATWVTGKFDIYNNEWNSSQAGPQTIWGFSYHHWGVESTQADTTSVKTYPSVQENYKSPLVTSLRRLYSSWQEQMPSVRDFDAEAAYDLWLNGGSGPYSIEVMMWVDNHGQRPSGRVVRHVNFYGKTYSLWQSGSHMFTFKLADKQEPKGAIHLLRMLRWLIRNGYLSSSVTLTQVNFGWEICSTDGKPMDFALTGYRLVTKS